MTSWHAWRRRRNAGASAGVAGPSRWLRVPVAKPLSGGAAALVAGVLLACASVAEPSDPPASAPEPGEPAQVGAAVEVSGRVAAVGSAVPQSASASAKDASWPSDCSAAACDSPLSVCFLDH